MKCIADSVLGSIRYLFLLVALGCSPAFATVIALVNDQGMITGATGVNVGGSLFDVEFLEGSCNGLFGGCDPGNFTFRTESDARLAAQALVDQVFGAPANSLGSETALSLGCDPLLGCNSRIPVTTDTFSGELAVGTIIALEVRGPRNMFQSTGNLSFVRATTVTQAEGTAGSNFVVFTPATAVPAPAALPLLGAALIALAWFRPRKVQT